MPYLKYDLESIIRGIHFWPEFKGKKIFLTGATGWIGSWIWETLSLANQKLDLRMTLYKHTQYTSFFPRDPFDIVIHAAFAHPGEVQIMGTQKLLRFADSCGAEKFLLLSSGILNTETPDPSYSRYKVTKGVEETLATCQWPFEVKIARMYTLAGPGLPLDRPFALSKFLRDSSQGVIHLDGYGDSVRSYIYMTDLVLWLLTILMKGEAKIPYLVGSDRPITIFSLAEKIAEFTDTIVTRHIDRPVLFTHYLPDLTLSRKLGLEITVPLDHCLKRTVDWFRDKKEGNQNDGLGGCKIGNSCAD